MDSPRKKFTCEVCDWGCGRIGNMVRHRRSHTAGPGGSQLSTTNTPGSTVTVTPRKFILSHRASITPYSDWRVKCPTIRDKNLYLLNSQIFSDVIFIVGERKEEMHAHKSILMPASPVFEVQFGGRWDPENKIEMPDVSPKAFRMFLEYLYADLFSVTENEAPEVLSLGHKYLTTCLVKKCCDLLASVINASNAIHIHQTAIKFCNRNLEKQAMEFILKNGNPVFEDIGFLQIGMDTLSFILKSDNLVTEEIFIFRAVMRWSENKCKVEKLDCTVQNKRLVLKDLISLIRFTLMTSEEFTNEVCLGKHEGILSAEESISVYKYWNVGQSMRTHLPPLPFNVNKRRHESLCKVDVYEAGVGHFRGVNCRFDNTGSCTTRCKAIFEFSSNRKIQLMGIELRQPTQSDENPMNSTFLALTNPESARLVPSDISASIYEIKKSSGGRPSIPDGIFEPRSLTRGFEGGIQIKENNRYCIFLSINAGCGQSSLKSISPGVGLKLANPARVICEEGNVEFKFNFRSTNCYRQDSDGHRSLDNCICNGLIKAIHFKI